MANTHIYHVLGTIQSAFGTFSQCQLFILEFCFHFCICTQICICGRSETPLWTVPVFWLLMGLVGFCALVLVSHHHL